ncbi:hypothetical protein F4802DRAFT_542636 [Xylaria palmicola]|nr:hypothetical protein F4802DRAFT_542636 [Xylaria palmicola]
MIMTFKSSRRLFKTISLRLAMSRSVLVLLSWASSTMIHLYSDRLLSSTIWARSIPSVIYTRRVPFPVLFSNRMLYPTFWPIFTPSSHATRCAIALAARRRGCVQATRP